MLNSGLTELFAALALRKISSRELTQGFIERVVRLNGALNAFITVDEEGALAAARRADERLARGEGGALTGIPLAYKDIYCTKGLRTTCGSRMLENFVSPYDAHVVERLNAEGAVLLGKCNMDQFAMGSSSESSYFGPVRNPWDTERVPGGSSGGSAAAVAARMVPAATGTDTGGSTRQPAAFSGVCGLRPTYGLVSRYGLIAFASSLDQAGPMARSAADLAVLLSAMVGFDPRDSTSLDRPRQDYSQKLDVELKGLRIGLPREYFAEGIEPGVRKAVDAAVAWFAARGALCTGLELPLTRLAVPVYYVIAPAEASSNLARFDGVRYGHRAREYADLGDMYRKTR
ncbi:MAG TPA: amidase family protein, partial [Beijerinckiaceae bacterium]|nr:amidase family protein [Beijerinckiaceae bacterium]